VTPEPAPVAPSLPEPALIEPSLVVPVQPPLQPELLLPTPMTEKLTCAASVEFAAEPHAETAIALPETEADCCATLRPPDDDANAAIDPVVGQRRSFADRLRDWLGRTA